jgi:hypothetical protein
MRLQEQRSEASHGDSDSRSTSLLLITGTPGSGKRVLGNLFVDERSFVHIDLDNTHANRRFLGHGVSVFRSELEANIEPEQPMVVTWTPRSDRALPFIRAMRACGFEWIWLDGDRGAAFSASFARLDGATPPRFVDPFEADGTFRPMTEVVDELLEPGDVVVPVPAPARRRRLVPAFSRARSERKPAVKPTAPRARAGIAAGLAFATAVTAAIVGLFFVAGPGTDGGLAPQPAQAAAPKLPKNGVLVKGRSLAGVKLGDSRAEVRSRWGRHFTVCKTCSPTTWIYSYPSGDPVGAGVKFRNGKVTAVFTLGMTLGWRTADGLRVGDVLKVNEHDGTWMSCNGYSARANPSANAITSILTVGPTVYGFALSRPSESVCH